MNNEYRLTALKTMINKYKFGRLINLLYSDKILILSIIVVSILAFSNTINKMLFDFEPMQYSLFSYDKILHYLSTIILIRISYWIGFNNFEQLDEKKLPIYTSIFIFFLYGIAWEIFELSTFILLEKREQIIQELLDIPLDWVYDILGILTSNFLGYIKRK